MTGWKDVTRVLCIRLDSLGDVLMTTPAIRAAREAAAHVTLLTSPAGAAVAKLVPEIDEVIVFEAPWMKAARASPAATVALIEQLRGRFDAAVIFTVWSQNPLPAAMLVHLAGIPLCLAHCRERAYHLVSDAVPETEPESGIRHEVRRQLDLVAQVGWRPSSEALSLAFSAADTAAVAPHVPPGQWALIHPGASAPSRRYPPEMFIEAMLLLAERGWRFVVTGDAGETALAGMLAAVPGAVSLAGRLSLGELAALIARAPVVIANNSGPAHIAAAVGTPVVDLYALTNPQHTPWQVPSRVLSHDVPCRWCLASVCPQGHHLCLRGVAPGAVAAAALELTA